MSGKEDGCGFVAPMYMYTVIVCAFHRAACVVYVDETIRHHNDIQNIRLGYKIEQDTRTHPRGQ